MQVHTIGPGQTLSIGELIKVSVVKGAGKSLRLVIESPFDLSIKWADVTTLSAGRLRDLIGTDASNE